MTVKLDRKLIVNVEEAATVRLIFSRYLDLGSVSALQRDLIRPPATRRGSMSGARRSCYDREGVGTTAIARDRQGQDQHLVQRFAAEGFEGLRCPRASLNFILRPLNVSSLGRWKSELP